MEKKKFNWLGFISILVLVPLLAVSVYLGVTTNDETIFAFTALGFVVSLVLVPILWVLGQRIALPKKKAWAKLVKKSMEENTIYVTGGLTTATNLFLTFEFEDGSQVSYSVPWSKYKLYSENEVGILTYKYRGNIGFIISFERKS